MTPISETIATLKKALAARQEAAERVKTELHAVAGTDVSRKALELYRKEYREAADHFMDLGLNTLPELIGEIESLCARLAAAEAERDANDALYQHMRDERDAAVADRDIKVEHERQCIENIAKLRAAIDAYLSKRAEDDRA